MAEIDVYKIAVDLMVENAATTGPLGEFIGLLERIRASLAETQTAIHGATTALGGTTAQASRLADQIGRVAESARQAAEAMSRMQMPAASAAPIAPVMRPAMLMLPAPAPAPASGAGGSAPPIGPTLRALPPPAGPHGGGIPLTGGAFVNAAGGGAVPPGLPPGVPTGAGRGPRLPIFSTSHIMEAYLGWHILKDSFEEGAKPDDIKAQMAAIYVAGQNGKATRGFTDEQIKQADALALKMQRTTPGLGYAEGLEIILKTASNLASSETALKIAPRLGLDAQVLSRIGHGDAIEQLEAAVQAGEIKGLNGPDGKVDSAKMADMIARLTQTAFSMGGTFNLEKYLTGLKQFGTGAGAASMDFVTAVMPAYMKIMGESKTGTSMDSLQSVMFAPVPKTRATHYQEEQERLGLRKGDTVVGADVLSRDENEYFTTVVLPKLIGAGYTTPAQIAQEIRRVFPRATVDRLAITSDKDQDLIAKEIARNKAQQSMGDAPLVQFLASAPGNQFKAMSESLKTLQAVTTDAAMKPTLDILNKLSTALLNISDYVKAHPDDVKRFGENVDILITTMIKVGTFIGKLPAPLRDAVIGAGLGATAGAPFAGIGAVPGALIGAGLGATFGVAGDSSDPNNDLPRKISALRTLNTAASDLAAKPVPVTIVGSSAPLATHVTNAAELGHAVTHGIASGATTAPTTAPGYQPLSTPQYPGHSG